jgi:hypothetical protein
VPDEPKRVPIKIIGAELCPSFYANIGAVVTTQFDIQLILGEVVQASEEAIVGRASVRVVMTPEHAMLLLKTMESRLGQWISTVGQLRMAAIDSISTAGTATGSLADMADAPAKSTDNA